MLPARRLCSACLHRTLHSGPLSPHNTTATHRTVLWKHHTTCSQPPATPTTPQIPTTPATPQTHPYFSPLIRGDRATLARSITLTESSLPVHRTEAATLMSNVLQHNANNPTPTLRIGISGPPGVGKSTFIETFGLHLLERGETVAVLAVDPSSQRSGGSLLADKTRMQHLSSQPAAFIRPSPNRGELGGVASTTHDAIQLCEASGYSTIIVETVGAGQSEIAVSNMVDMFLLLIPPGGGDELQGIKKGIVEVSDMVVVTKADAHLAAAARLAKTEYSRALRLTRNPSDVWQPFVLTTSSHTGEGIAECWREVCRFKREMLACGEYGERRKQQRVAWFRSHIQTELFAIFSRDPEVRGRSVELEQEVRAGLLSPGVGAHLLVQHFLQQQQPHNTP